MSAYEPGALCLATVRGIPGRRVFRSGQGWQSSESWHSEGSVTDIRPLVVIDPEDREQVERFIHTYWRGFGSLAAMVGRTDELLPKAQAALREFAHPTPPKPEEPTGLGAVVEDERGDKWVRKGNTDHGEDWSRQIGNAWTGDSWDRIDAVRILSPGVDQ